MRAALIALFALMISGPAFAVDPWAGATVVAEGSVKTDATRSGFGTDFAGTGTTALEDNVVDPNALADIAPAAGETDKDAATEAADVEPAAGIDTPVITEDSGEPVQLETGDKENKIVGP